MPQPPGASVVGARFIDVELDQKAGIHLTWTSSQRATFSKSYVFKELNVSYPAGRTKYTKYDI
jgi:hypothetical protein